MSEPQWAPASCTLPTVERPLREREFGTLFRTALLHVQAASPERAEFTLQPASEDTARALAAKETSCCSFFEFTFDKRADNLVMTVQVPAVHASVLAALVTSAATDANLEVTP
jgi:hypothetical protein